jgi:hypothetical protein
MPALVWPWSSDGAPFAAQTVMRTGVEDRHEKLVGAIDHASHSLAQARESLRDDATTVVRPPAGPLQARARAEVAHVARLLDEAREPGRVSPETIEGAATALDQDLGLMTKRAGAETKSKVIETRLEERDGGTWVTGLCPFCWERVGVRLGSDAAPTSTLCPNGHRLGIDERRSAGRA